MQHTNSDIEIKESLLKGLEFNGREAKEYSHENVMNVMEEYASQRQLVEEAPNHSIQPYRPLPPLNPNLWKHNQYFNHQKT